MGRVSFKGAVCSSSLRVQQSLQKPAACFFKWQGFFQGAACYSLRVLLATASYTYKSLQFFLLKGRVSFKVLCVLLLKCSYPSKSLQLVSLKGRVSFKWLCGNRPCGNRLCGNWLCRNRRCGNRLCGNRLCLFL